MEDCGTKKRAPRPKKTPKTLVLYVDCRGLFGGEKDDHSRIIEIPFVIRDNKLIVRPYGTGKYVEVGRIIQLRISDYCEEVGVRCDYVWAPPSVTDCYRITLDKETIDELYQTRRTLTVDDLSTAYGYLHYKETSSFYDVCLMDYSELPEELEREYEEGREYEFVVVRNERFPTIEDVGYRIHLH